MINVRKVVIHRAGGYEQLRIEEHPLPEPGDGEILVRVAAAGVNFADVIVRQGLYESAKKYVGWPITPGFEFAGTVQSVGSGVGGFASDDRVFGITRFGAYASHVVVPSHQLFRIPKGFTIEQAAAFPAVFFTAYHPLFQLMHLRPRANVLVHSAAGGVGTALLQLLRAAGCRSVGVVGAPHKVEVARRFGAEHVIDKSREDLWRAAEALAPEGYDVILDANGPATLRQSYEHLAPVGKLVIYGFHTMFDRRRGWRGGAPNYLKLAREWFRVPRFNPLDLTSSNKSVLGFNLSFLFERRDLLEQGMAELLRWIEEGKIQPPEVHLYPFERAADAHRALESGQTTGKLVLTM